ncbi:MAG: hypothetical protein H3C27_13595 [Opitutaceae bacterium]|nr:hypothetical protein [Opitutaceae bacterium]
MNTGLTPDVFTATVEPLMRAAKESGATPEALSAAFMKALLGLYGQPAAKDFSAKIGFMTLISQEGGVASAKEAAGLYGGRKPATDEAVRKAARLGQLIVAKDGRGFMLFPRWQFSEKGGGLPGLRDTMKVLRQHPHFHDLLPFTFFLNPSTRLGGKRPLDLLRDAKADDIHRVLNLAATAAE